jgi:hypothetical protein
MHTPQTERRSPTRLADPKCPQCQGALTRVIVRTPDTLYYRCADCDDTWLVPKPGVETGDPDAAPMFPAEAL